ncbi:MAG: type VII secretion protein EssC, partial [Lachnospiraceae bacterium]|nr:type VII secretion protein EssC [Lachnospiraceae bacterium]
LNIMSRWKENNPVLSLQAPIGVNSDGDLFYLDLHENAHGPHGLVAGMTGSGKSEFIITYVLSLAVNYSPDDVAFILIDYKGGGLVGAFDNEQYRLPHLAGTITNLDGAAINRSLLSIQSELRRRQVIFNEARRVSNEGTMDIYKYQKLYRNGVVSEPIPHLMIISDEFAELKTQQPEFMTQLISTARIGRSLGVHLILATQKPSGVVNDQIWANSKFKVCLKVQDRADSMDMLKRPDAAELVETGRFYLQVGYNELFELGQSAWCGAPYYPSDTLEVETDESVQMIDHLGNVIEEVKPARKVANSGDARKQIVEIAQYISQIANEENLHARPLWMPEIPAVITVDQMKEKYRYQDDILLNPVIGEVDDPFNQSQRLLTLPLSEIGNAVCYGVAGSGKETFVTALLYSLYESHSSDFLNTYILDFGAETLRMFEKAPQTGDVIVAGEEEKTASLFRYLQREITRRKKLFADVGGDFLSYCKTGKNDIPNIVVVINNYTNFAEQFEALDERMASITRDCSKYGVFFILTCVSSSGIRYKLRQNFPLVYVLQQNDKMDYASLLGNTGGVYPSQIAGRGIYRDKDVYEFQTAYVSDHPENTGDAVRAFCEKLTQTEQIKAMPVPMLPKAVQKKHLGQMQVSFDHVPVGMDADTTETVFVNMERGGVEQVLAMDLRDTTAFAGGMCGLIQNEPSLELYVIDPAKLLSAEGFDEAHYATDKPGEMVVRLFQLTVERHNTYKTMKGVLPEEMYAHPVVVLLVGLGRIKNLLNEDGVDKLRLILEKTSGKFRLFFWAFDDYKAANLYNTEEWCRGDGIWVGNGIRDQVRLKVSGRIPAAMKNLDFTDGHMIMSL